jgi:hypothetical protein
MPLRIGWILLLLFVVPLIVRAESKPLPETYVSDDEATTLRHPTGWIVWADQPGLVIVSTSDKPTLVGQENISPGEAAVVVLFSNADDGYLRAYFQGDDAAAILDHFIQTLFVPSMGNVVEFGIPHDTHFADFPAVRSDGLFFDSSINVIVVDRGSGRYSLVVLLTTASEQTKFEPKLLAIAESVNYRPPSQ